MSDLTDEKRYLQELDWAARRMDRLEDEAERLGLTLHAGSHRAAADRLRAIEADQRVAWKSLYGMGMLLDATRRALDKPTAGDGLLKCCVCGRQFRESEKIAAKSADNPGCPSCGSDNYVDQEVDHV